MPTDCISYQDSGYFSPLINDYLNQKDKLNTLYNRFPVLDNFEKQLQEKSANFLNANRVTLVKALQEQYANIDISTLTKQNIDFLKADTTFTITTGHQLNLFSGPLYFLYKIISTINLTKELKGKYPAHNFVPIYWMATEDHDFEEINYFNFKGKKFRWNKESTGPVGRLSTKGLAEFFDIYQQELGTSTSADQLKKIFTKSYLEHDNLTDATRYLANALFGSYGLVILDADNQNLKRNFIPYVKEELLHQTAHKAVVETTEQLKTYNIQVNPREINLFYIEDKVRERIILENGVYKVNNTKQEFTTEQILALLDSNPECFSPNVILRPLYQEVILPNLCYIGGGGEIAYWLELKSFFDTAKVTFPMLLVRNSVLIATEKQANKADKLNLSWTDLFAKQIDLINKQTVHLSEFSIDMSPLKEQLQKQFEALHLITEQTDPSFVGAVKAQETKQIKGLDNLEKRLLRAQKRKLADVLERVTDLQNELFPNKSLQERQTNFSEFYLESGEKLIPALMAQLKPLEQNFTITIL
jgi:bacillithiol biosynthesis cysteine-adding enzyme BshC